LRFKDGYLDGESQTSEGLRLVQAAVEAEGHLEYRRQGKLHRDNGLPALYSRKLREREWWIEGARQKKPEREA
jgi:hypothetical protein